MLMAGALDGIRVVDLSHVLAAPTTTMILADLGAEVIHIEPEWGDDAREYGPFIGRLFYQSESQQKEPCAGFEIGRRQANP